MSDSEGSIPSPCSSKKSVALDETIETMPIQQNHNDDKIEEFEKLLQSMIVSRSVSEEEDQVEQEDNANDKKIVGKSNLQSPNIFILQSKNLLNIIRNNTEKCDVAAEAFIPELFGIGAKLRSAGDEVAPEFRVELK
ncbi:hypothetical protein DMN91_008558 [Ooceraea biroi]|uniref:Uncharacterized protein n=1 Tax=Ooceraea biroi TaxID=2015173 RepID=A0A3L8DDG2_OOCBI|nr:hypothetical protein DMN91_008558 [Ooceraea biroi]